MKSSCSTSAFGAIHLNLSLVWGAGAVFLWSQSAACLKFVLAITPWLTVALWSSVISTIVYGVAIVITGRVSLLRVMPLREVAKFAAIGVVGYFFYTCFVYTAYASGPAAEVLIVNYLWPVATVVFSALLSHERLRYREIAGIMLALAGVVAVVTRGQLQWPQALAANLLALSAAVCYGLYSAVSKRLKGDREIALFIAFASVSMLFFLAVIFTRAPLYISNSTTRWLVVYHGVVISAIPALFWLKALATGYTPHLAVFVYLTPMFGLLWLSLVFVSEPITIWMLVGMMLVVAGFFVQFLFRTSVAPIAKNHN